MTMPWEKPPAQSDDLAIPAFLKRDANNIAPYMRVNHEGSPPNSTQVAPLPWEPNSSSHS